MYRMSTNVYVSGCCVQHIILLFLLYVYTLCLFIALSELNIIDIYTFIQMKQPMCGWLASDCASNIHSS